MNFWIAVAFGAGITAWAYSRVGRRVGYNDQKSVVTILGAIFVLSTIFFYTVLRFIIPH